MFYSILFSFNLVFYIFIFFLQIAQVQKSIKPLTANKNLANLKIKVHKLDIDKLAPVPVDSSKLSDVVKNDVVKKTVYDKLVGIKLLSVKN